MEILKTIKKIDKATKIKLLLLFAAGVFLLIFSNYLQKDMEKTETPLEMQEEKNKLLENTSKTIDTNIPYEETLENRLANILSEVDGAGMVTVLITTTTGKETVVKENRDETEKSTEETDDKGGKRFVLEAAKKIETVMVRQSDGSENPIILQEKMPQIEGVIIVAEGGDDPIIKDKLIRAAQAVLGIDIHKIAVLKRK